MATLADIQQSLTDLSTVVGSVNTDLDRVAAEIQSLKDQVAAGGVITQEQLDALGQQVTDIKTAAQAVLAESQSL